jgi:hypothetical protein
LGSAGSSGFQAAGGFSGATDAQRSGVSTISAPAFLAISKAARSFSKI